MLFNFSVLSILIVCAIVCAIIGMIGGIFGILAYVNSIKLKEFYEYVRWLQSKGELDK